MNFKTELHTFFILCEQIQCKTIIRFNPKLLRCAMQTQTLKVLNERNPVWNTFNSLVIRSDTSRATTIETPRRSSPTSPQKGIKWSNLKFIILLQLWFTSLISGFKVCTCTTPYVPNTREQVRITTSQNPIQLILHLPFPEEIGMLVAHGFWYPQNVMRKVFHSISGVIATDEAHTKYGKCSWIWIVSVMEKLRKNSDFLNVHRHMAAEDGYDGDDDDDDDTKNK